MPQTHGRLAERVIPAAAVVVTLAAGSWLAFKAMPGAIWVASVLAALAGALPA